MARIILIAGGSSSGKSYVTTSVIKHLNDPDIMRITLDDYYNDHSHLTMEERNKLNYDHPKAFDWKLMRQQVKALKEGREIDKPMYDFRIHNRKKETEHIVPRKVVLLEGIMALVDEEIRSYGDIKIFINASKERRFLRRLIRDRQERGRDFESIVHQYFATVAPMYGEIIAPSKQYADLIINNDGVENCALDIVAGVLKQQLEYFDHPQAKLVAEPESFDEQILKAAFEGLKGN